MSRFALRFPALFHVADRAALPGVRRDGLLSAASLCALHGVPLPSENRAGYLPLGPGAALRRQGMGDAALATRLASGLTPAGWRGLINGMVFLFAREAEAWTLRAREAARDQVVLRFDTAAMLRAGLDLRVCRYNNGFIDRSPPGRRRLRGPADYVPVGEWNGEPPREVTVPDRIPPTVPFAVIPSA